MAPNILPPQSLVGAPALCGTVGLVGLDVRCACLAGGRLVLGCADGTLRVYGAPAERSSSSSSAGGNAAFALLKWVRCSGYGSPSSVSYLPSIHGFVAVEPWLSNGTLLRAAIAYPSILQLEPPAEGEEGEAAVGSSSARVVHCSDPPEALELPNRFLHAVGSSSSRGGLPSSSSGWHVCCTHEQGQSDRSTPPAPPQAIVLPTGGGGDGDGDGDGGDGGGGGGDGGGGQSQSSNVDVLCVSVCEGRSGRVAAIGCEGRLLVYELWRSFSSGGGGAAAAADAATKSAGVRAAASVVAEVEEGEVEVEVVASSSVCVSLLCVVALSHSLVPRCVSVCDGTIAVASASELLALHLRVDSSDGSGSDGGGGGGGDGGGDGGGGGGGVAGGGEEGEEGYWSDVMAADGEEEEDDGGGGLGAVARHTPPAHELVSVVAAASSSTASTAATASDKILVSSNQMTAGHSASLQMVLTVPRTPSTLLTRIPFHEPWADAQPGRTLPTTTQRRALLTQPRTLPPSSSSSSTAATASAQPTSLWVPCARPPQPSSTTNPPPPPPPPPPSIPCMPPSRHPQHIPSPGYSTSASVPPQASTPSG